MAETNEQFQSDESEEAASPGDELIDGTGWVTGTGWSGDFTNGFTHTKGNTAPLTRPLSGLGYGFYQVEITVSSPSTTKTSNSGWTVSLGGSEPFEMYEGNFTEHTYIRGVKALGGSDVVITPETGFDGTIKNVSVREIVGTVTPTLEIKDSKGITSFEVKPTKSENENVFMGFENALYNTTGKQNVGIGNKAMRLNTTGFWNVAVGRDTLQQNTVGSRNVAIGYIALRNNVSGHRNISIGPFTLLDNTSGHNNIALGADTLQRNKTGHHNIALGVTAMSNNLEGEHNIAAGRGALLKGESLKHNVALGDMTLHEMAHSGRSSIAIGERALRYSTEGRNIAIGSYAGHDITTAIDNIAIGIDAQKENQTGERNLVIGNYSAHTSNLGDRNLIIGGNSATALESNSSYNVVLGHASGNTLKNGIRNILIGYNVDTPNPIDNDILNIGNFLHGRMGSNQQRFGIGVSMPLASLHLNAGKSTQFGAPIRFENGELLNGPENGALEYDGTALYLTDNTGTRRKIMMEAV